MKAFQLLVIGVITCALGFEASGNAAPAPGAFQKRRIDSPREQGPVPCLLGTQKCASRNNPPVKACLVHAMSAGSCPVDGFKVTQADLR